MSDKITIIRATKNADNPYVVLRKAIPQDKELSWEARGMLSYILSQPDNWKVIPKNLEQKCGKSVVYRILNELIAAGYITRTPKRDQNQRFVSWIYEVYEVPQPKKTAEETDPLPTNPEMAQPEMENRDALLSTESLPSTESTKKDITSGVADVPPAKPNGHEPTPKKARPRNEWYDVIAETMGVEGFKNTRIANVLRACGKGEYAKYDLEVPLTDPEQVREFWKWYQKVCAGCSLGSPATVQDFVMRWQKEKASTPARPRPLEPMEPPPPDPIYPGDGIIPVYVRGEE
jgi:hypothetical protein